MQYGAYRRWKLAEDSNLDSKGKPKKKKSKSSTGYQAGDYKVDGANGGEAIGSRDVGGKKKKSKGGSLNADSFYDAIKKFGSGAKVSTNSSNCTSLTRCQYLMHPTVNCNELNPLTTGWCHRRHRNRRATIEQKPHSTKKSAVSQQL
jgi:hypothetical protein